MPETVDLKAAFGLPPEEAMRYFEGKDLKTTVNWTEVWEGGHARHFTVAKIAQIDLLTSIRQSLAEALAKGETFETWKAGIVETLAKAGWWGTVRNKDLTGTEEAIYVGPRRLKVIYDTNLRTARAAGQWARIRSAKARRPYLRYSAVLDRRTRPQHRAWHNTVLPVDHDWWKSHFPPNGWFCRCSVQQLSDADLTRYGYAVTPPPPEGPPTKYVSRTGFKAEVPAGIDPGFGHNTGRAGLQAIVERASEALQKSVEAGLAAPARSILDTMLASPAVEQVLVDHTPRMPVAILDDALASTVGATTRIVTLSERSLLHVRQENRRDYPPSVFRALASAFEQPLLQVLQDNGRLATIYEVDGTTYLVVLDATEEPGAVIVWTMHRIRSRNVAAYRRRGRVLVDRWPG